MRHRSAPLPHAGSHLETALHFSTVSFTTVGHGDVTASPDWRLLGSFEAAAGMLLFGVSTAFLFEVMLSVWRRPDRTG
mgnify:CR=1 FL=1